MQKSMFLNKKLDTAHHLLKLGTVSSKGSLRLGKTSKIRIFSTGRIFMHF